MRRSPLSASWSVLISLKTSITSHLAGAHQIANRPLIDITERIAAEVFKSVVGFLGGRVACQFQQILRTLPGNVFHPLQGKIGKCHHPLVVYDLAQALKVVAPGR